MKKSLFTYLRIIALSLLILPYSLSAQNFQWVNWSPRQGLDSDYDNFNAVAVDPSGNSYLAAQFSGILNIGSYSFQSNFVEDVCILKYAPDGQFLWAKAIGSQYWDQVNGMDCDAEGNLYLTGHYFGVLRYGNDSLVGNAGGREMFLMKIEPDGDVAWAVNGANPWDEEGTDVRALPGGGVVMSGRARTTASIGNLQLVDTTLLMVEFIAAFSDDGLGQWIGICGPAGSSSLTYSNSNLENGADSSIYIAYSGYNEIYLNGDTIRPWYYPEFSANYDVIVQKWSSTGQPIWGWIGGSYGQDLFSDFTVDQLGRVYAGINSPMVNYFGQDSLPVTPGDWSSTVIRLNNDGSEDTAWHNTSTGFSTWQSAACDAQGNVWMGGILRETLVTDVATFVTPTVNHRQGMLFRINSETDSFDRYDEITGQGWYSILNMRYSNALESLVFGGNATASNAAPTSFGLDDDFVIGFSSTGGNWAYLVRYTADSCQTPSPLFVTDSLLCPGQIATISFVDSLSYPLWNNGSTESQITVNTGTAIQLLAIQPNGCFANLEANIQTSSPVQFTAETTFITCNGLNDGAVDVTLTSGLEPVSYSWSNGQTTQDLENLTTGNYTLTAVSAHGCSRSQVYSVTQPLIINGILSESNGTLTIGSITGGTPPYTFTWENFPGETGNTVNFDTPGSYTINITDSRGCTATESIAATSAESIENHFFEVYPNPASDFLKIEDRSGRNFNYTVLTVDGRLVLTGSSVQGNTIALSAWPQGIYLLRVEDFTGNLMVKRFEVIR